MEVNMKLAMVSSSLLLIILCTKFTPGEALDGMRQYKRNWQENTRELLKRILLGHKLNDKSSDEISRDLSPPSSDVYRPPSGDEWTQLFDSSSCSDSNEKHCPIWGKLDYCTKGKYVIWMKKNCQKTCDTCNSSSDEKTECKDEKDGCGYWKKLGYCKESKYTPYMKIYCKESCELC